jgi:hypothetical protein
MMPITGCPISWAAGAFHNFMPAVSDPTATCRKVRWSPLGVLANVSETKGTIAPFAGVYTIGETAVSAGCCRIASVSQTDLLERLPHKRQMGVDVMPGRYLNKLHPVRVSLGIFPTGGDGQQGNGNGRPVTRHDSPTPTANGNGRAGQLVYGDGTAVDPGKQKEAATYHRYLATKQSAPASKAALVAYYRAAVG